MNSDSKLIDELTDEIFRRLAAQEKSAADALCLKCQGRGPESCTCNFADLCAAGADRIGGVLGMGHIRQDVAALIDHTLLKPQAMQSEIETLCAEAIEHNFMSVCVQPCWVETAAKILMGTGVATCTVIGFPLGANEPEIKAAEARLAQDKGAIELDMVINVGRLKSGQFDRVRSDIAAVVGARRSGSLVKVIIETCLLTDDEKRRACQLAREAGADFVKTSTGFAGGGATAEDIALMRQTVGGAMGVKASGGVRNREDLDNMVRAGASRIGASAGIKIVTEN